MKALVEAALVGTARQPDRARTALAGDMPVDALVAEVDDGVGVERRVLLAAALHDTYARAGRVPRADVEVVSPAGSESAPLCSPVVTGLLADLLAIRPRVLLAEALTRLSSAGMLVTPVLLPDLLDTRDPLLETALRRVIGQRGRWLAALVGDDDLLMADALDPAEARRIWQEGAPDERVQVLSIVRGIDPDQAREWLAETWSSESADYRALLTNELGEGLNAGDVPFLERALDDRSVNVRIAAALLLARRPESESAQRFVARADAMLDYQPPTNAAGVRALLKKAVGLTSTGTLVVRPPEQVDAAWVRDGLTAKPPSGVGERAHWLMQSLVLVPPAHWEARFRATPADLVRAAASTEWTIPLLHGWSVATIQHGGASWAAALWDAWVELRPGDGATRADVATRATMLMQLPRQLRAEDAEQRVLSLMARPASELPFGLAALVDVAPAPWSVEFGRRFLARVADQLTAAASATQWSPGNWFEALAPVALTLPPESFVAALELEQRLSAVDTLPPAYRRKLEEFRDVVRLRQRIHEEIPGEPARR